MRMIPMTYAAYAAYAVSPPVGTCHPKDPGDHRCRPTFEQWKWLGRPRAQHWALGVDIEFVWGWIFYDFVPC